MDVDALPPATIATESDGSLRCSGDWTVGRIHDVARQLRKGPASAAVEAIDGSAIARLDTAGAWLLHRTARRLAAGFRGFSPDHQSLLDMVAATGVEGAPGEPLEPAFLERVGRQTAVNATELTSAMAFIGETALRLARVLVRPHRIRWFPLMQDLQTAGLYAMPIIGLLSFLVGVVIAYQGAVLLKLYGADIYVVDMVGLAMVREMAPMMAAVIVAGRTGSAYAAQIGTMVVTEEVDALRTVGIPPHDILVVPKILSLMLALPLLTVFADITGIIGGMTLVHFNLGLGFNVFIDRLVDAVSFRSFLLGLIKTPVFAVIIVMAGCYQGFRVRGGAQSVGHHTTRAVVHSIFLVIVANAAFSVLFSWLGIAW